MRERDHVVIQDLERTWSAIIVGKKGHIKKECFKWKKEKKAKEKDQRRMQRVM